MARQLFWLREQFLFSVALGLVVLALPVQISSQAPIIAA